MFNCPPIPYEHDRVIAWCEESCFLIVKPGKNISWVLPGEKKLWRQQKKPVTWWDLTSSEAVWGREVVALWHLVSLQGLERWGRGELWLLSVCFQTDKLELGSGVWDQRNREGAGYWSMELLEQHLIIWMTHGCRLVLWRIAQRRAVRQQKATLIPSSPQEKWFSAFGADAQALLRPSGQAAQCPRSVGGDRSAGYFPRRHVEACEKSVKEMKNSLNKWM